MRQLLLFTPKGLNNLAQGQRSATLVAASDDIETLKGFHKNCNTIVEPLSGVGVSCPLTQGGPFMHVIAAKAVCFGEAQTEEFKEYQRNVVANAGTLAQELEAGDLRIVSGGTDNHLLLVDLTPLGITGRDAEDAEAIRDSILAASGKLDLAMGGPGFSLFEIEKENVRHYFPKQKFGPADWRRMVYATKFRQGLDDVFGAFDCPDGNQSVPRRGRSTTPMQALNLLNSAFVLDQADHLAARVKKDAGKNAEAQVRRAFHLTLGRAPESRELAAAKKLAATHGLPALARALFNTHEFITIP